MTDQNTFMETVRAVAEIMKAAEKPLSREEISGYFRDMELSEKQQEMVYQYLLQPKEEKPQEKQPEVSRRKAKTPLVPLPDSVFFKMYLKELRRIPVCTPEEETALYERLSAGEEAAVKLLSDQWQPRVLDLARRQEVASDELADVIQEGNMGVLLALSGMLGSGRKAGWQDVVEAAAREAMASYIVQSARASDAGKAAQAKAALVYEARKVLAEDLQRMPTDAELCRYTKLQEEELADILGFMKDGS